MLAPVVRRDARVRQALVGTGLVLPPTWALALGVGGGAHPLLAAGGGVVGLAAALVLGSGFADVLVQVDATRRRQAAVRLGLGGAAVVALVTAAIVAGGPGLLDVDADTTTLRIVATGAVALLPFLVALQVVVWRLTVSSWRAGRPLEPVHARQLAATTTAVRGPADRPTAPSP
jgi:hypothetical protein